jgi:hypothetical protein
LNSRLRIIVAGLIAQYPLGGVTWDYIQYVLGLSELGHDVYYLEDTRQWPYNAIEGGLAKDSSFNVGYLTRVMKRFGLEDRWAYHFPGGKIQDGRHLPAQWFGMPDAKRIDVINTADLLIDVSSGLGDASQFDRVGRLVYVDTDPVFTQIRLIQDSTDFRNQVDAHHVHFSYGECLSRTDFMTGHEWHPMRKPIVLSEWRPSTLQRDTFTTVMNWTSYDDVNFKGQSYGQKDIEFMKFMELPGCVNPVVLELALGQGITNRAPLGLLVEKGWRIVDPLKVCPDVDTYREYIESSKAEWTIAKNGYVSGKIGWFSGRSACYLAAGRPVVVQDTGFTSVLPAGEGLLMFSDIREAAEAIKRVESQYARHSKAARAVAEEYFDSKKVLTGLVDTAMRCDKETASNGSASSE